MGIFSKKRTVDESNRLLICPQCRGTNLYYKNRTNFYIQQARLECPDCGYSGYIFLDNSLDDKKIDVIDKEFLAENPDFVTTRQPAWILAKLSLEHKWIPNQENNEHDLRSWCPFCEDVNVICDICKCPKEICANHATEGLIGELNRQYPPETKLSDVEPQKYQKIVNMFQNLFEMKSI